MTLTYTEKAFNITCDPDQKRIFINITKNFPAADFKESMLQALGCAQIHTIKQWLLDLRTIGKLGEEEEAWVFSEFFPQLMIALGSNNCIAMLLSKKCYQRLLSEVGKLGLMTCNTFIRFNNFCEEQEALAWLDAAKPDTVQP